MKYFLQYRFIKPGGLTYRLLFNVVRILYTLRLLKPNTRIHYIQAGSDVVVLTPLAGSSSIRASIRDVKTVDLLETANFGSSTVYVMDRPYNDRMQSFYNKKVRNPTNLGKIVLLALCPPLNYSSSVEEFREYLKVIESTPIKDKHLYSTDEIIQALDLNVDTVRKVDISKDAEFLENILKIDLSRSVHTTDDVAIFARPVTVSFDKQ